MEREAFPKAGHTDVPGRDAHSRITHNLCVIAANAG